MSINPVFRMTDLQPEEVKRLELAYKHALRSLSLLDRDDPLTRILAKKIIEVGAFERDPQRISDIVIKDLRIS